MNLRKGNKIVTDFIDRIKSSQFSINRSQISRNVYTINNRFLLYVKSRSEYPLKWGLTANVINRLNNQDMKWAVVLIYLKPENGYLLSSDDVNYYIKNVWPLARDGDYKPATGNYLSKNKPFNSVNEFFDSLKILMS